MRKRKGLQLFAAPTNTTVAADLEPANFSGFYQQDTSEHYGIAESFGNFGYASDACRD